MEDSDNYIVMNNMGMIVEKTESFPKNISGDISDILIKGRNILKEEEGQSTTIDIMFENTNLVIMNNEKGVNAIATLVDQKKK